VKLFLLKGWQPTPQQVLYRNTSLWRQTYCQDLSDRK